MDKLLTGILENVAHLQDNSDFEFVQHDVTASGRDISPTYGPAKLGEQLRSCVDPVTAATRTLGWRPETDLSAGLKQTLSLFGAL